jgi:hypothetical protein
MLETLLLVILSMLAIYLAGRLRELERGYRALNMKYHQLMVDETEVKLLQGDIKSVRDDLSAMKKVCEVCTRPKAAKKRRA